MTNYDDVYTDDDENNDCGDKVNDDNEDEMISTSTAMVDSRRPWLAEDTAKNFISIPPTPSSPLNTPKSLIHYTLDTHRLRLDLLRIEKPDTLKRIS